MALLLGSEEQFAAEIGEQDEDLRKGGGLGCRPGTDM
jgi:hypothetical protein